MTILNHITVQINNETIPYEGAVKITNGTKTRKANPQINGGIIYTTDNTTNFATIKITVRNTEDNNKFFDQLYRNGNGNVISAGTQSFVNASLESLPEREDQATTEYTFFADAQL